MMHKSNWVRWFLALALGWQFVVNVTHPYSGNYKLVQSALSQEIPSNEGD